jgi:tetratricopeptide (TPR) repeat protein
MPILESKSYRALGISLAPALMTVALCLPLLLTGCHNTAANLREDGRLALNRGQASTALVKTQQAADINPGSAQTQYQLGLIHLELDQPLQAQYALEKALAIRPNDRQLTPRTLDALAESLYRQDRMPNLFEFLGKQVKTYNTTRDYLRQGEYLAKAGDPDAARLAFRKAAYFANEKDPQPYIAIADFYTSVGDQPNAILSLRYANYVDPGNLDVAERLRRFDIVPGPTIAQAPPKPAKPALLR